MTLASWWRTDTLPHLPALPGFQATVASDDKELAHLNGLTVREVQARRQAGHRPYVGSMDGTPVTYGWVATREATTGELRLRFQLLPGDRYLWDFATLPAWQGRGLYPRLLGAILAAESVTAERAWIIHAPENLPSGAGIQKAGFIPAGRLSFGAGGGVALTPMGSLDRARACSAWHSWRNHSVPAGAVRPQPPRLRPVRPLHPAYQAMPVHARSSRGQLANRQPSRW